MNRFDISVDDMQILIDETENCCYDDNAANSINSNNCIDCSNSCMGICKGGCVGVCKGGCTDLCTDSTR